MNLEGLNRFETFITLSYILIVIPCSTLGANHGPVQVVQPMAMGPVVDTANGKVRGTLGTSRQGMSYFQFLGIPFAKPPVNDLRFELPQKVDNWSGILEATRIRKPCIQFEVMFLGRVQGVEDCLYLNVYTPQIPSDSGRDNAEKLLPVMVFIHGGAFMSGSPGLYKGKYFMDENVVLVTMAYRIASFGFLSTGDGVVRGNMGLQDQNLALQWVQENIRNFGGDPSRVTLFGESSGAVSVHMHMISPLSRGLFHRAISQSGTATRRYVLTDDLLGQARHLARRVGCAGDGDSREVVDCLKSVSAVRIAAVHEEAMASLRTEFSLYGPTVEAINDEKTFLGEEPINILKSGNFMRVPWIAGVNSADGVLFAARVAKDPELSRSLENLETWNTKIPLLLNFDDTSTSTNDAALKIRDFYFPRGGSPTSRSNFQNLTDMFSDRMYFLPTKYAAELHSEFAPVHLYYFDFKTTGSVLKLVEATQQRNSRIIPAEVQIVSYIVESWLAENVFGNERPFYGASHADELFLLFNLNIVLEARLGTPDYETSRKMVKIWADFAKGRDGDSVLFSGNKWPELDPKSDASFPYLRIGKKISVIDEPFEDRLRFWRSLNATFFGQEL